MTDNSIPELTLNPTAAAEEVPTLTLESNAPAAPAVPEPEKPKAEPVEMDLERFRKAGVEMYGFPLIARESRFARHDPNLLAQAVINVFGRCCVREGVYGAYDMLARETAPGKI